MTERPPDAEPPNVRVAIGQTNVPEIQFMIALDNLCTAFVTMINDDDAFERALAHIAEKWGIHKLPKDF